MSRETSNQIRRRAGTFRSLGLGPMRFELNRFEPDRSIPRHEHAYAQVCLVASGTVTERLDDRCVLEAARDSIVVTPAGQKHSNHVGASGACIITLSVAPSTISALGALGLHLERPLARSARSGASLAAHALHELSWAGSEDEMVLQGLALELLGSLKDSGGGDGTGRPGDWLSGVRDRLVEESHQTLSLDQLASDAGVHPSHLARAFRKRYGTSVGAYLRSVRLERAVALIVGGSASLAEVATACGFYDQSHLSRIVRQRLGVTPGELRRRSRRRL